MLRGLKSGAIACLLVAGVAASDQTKHQHLDVADIVKRSAGCVAYIEVHDGGGKSVTVGSGFVADSNGVIISSLHVFDGAASATIKLEGGAEFTNPLVAGFDRERDIIVLRVPSSKLCSLPMNRSGTQQVGEKIVVIGNPAGLSGTVSDGIVSSVREAESGRLYQITAPVSPGSSGGPVLNMQGEVVAIIAFTMRSGQNLNFAVPVSYVFPLLQSPKSLTLAQLSAPLSGGGEAPTESTARPALTASDQYRLGLDLYGKNKQREAIEAFKKAIELDPGYAESYFQIGSILAGDPHSGDQAISYLQDGLKISPEDSVAHSLLAVLYRGDRRYGDSITESKKAIAISPLNPAFHLVLAVTFEENQRYEEAIAESREAIQLRRNYATAYYHLAMSQERVGDPKAAEQSWRAFLRIAGSKSASSEEVRIAREHLARISGRQ